MPSHYDDAGEAIGQAVLNWYPSAAHNWGNKIPATSWGMERQAWGDMLSEILANFNDIAQPCRCGPRDVFDGTRKKELYLLQRLIAETARCPGEDDD